METVALAASLTQMLAPFLPWFLDAGRAVAETAGEALQSEARTVAEGLWARLRERVMGRPAARDAAEHVARAPDDGDARTALRLELEKLLADDPALLAEIAKAHGGAQPLLSVHAGGERSVAIGGNVSGSTLSTGDRVVPPPAGGPG